MEEKKLSGHDMIYVTGCKNPKAVSIIIRGGSEYRIDDLERGMHDALMVVGKVVKNKKVVAGGGAPETMSRSRCGAMHQRSVAVSILPLRRSLLHLRSSRDPLLKMPGSIPSPWL